MSNLRNVDWFALFWAAVFLSAVAVGGLIYCELVSIAYVMEFARVHIKPVVVSLFQQNQFMQVVAFGSVSAYFWMVANMLYRMFVLPLFTGMQCSVVIHNTDPSFHAVMDYISDHLLQNMAGAQYSLQVNTKMKEAKTRKDYIQEWLRGEMDDANQLVYRPDNDQVIHKIEYKGKMILLERAKSQPMMGREKPFTPECLKLTTWGCDNTVLKTLMNDAVIAAKKQMREGTVSIYTLSSGWCSGWELALTKKARPRESVILDMQDMDMLLDDARNFLQSGKWYMDMGIPYRRGFLLYGPPGCGKTSFAQVLAGELQLDICILNLTHSGLTDDAMAEYLRDAPQNSVIVLEDVDAIFVERTATKSEGKERGGNTSVSFSGLLNALDGVASQEGRLLFMTTNHIEKLDPALIRPGRCDVQLQLKLASKNQMERMFLRFYPGEEELAKIFASSLPANELSMASLQGYFLKCSSSAKDCARNTSELLHASRPTPPAIKSVYEHLRRVGLERYAPMLEFHGVSTERDLSCMKIEDIEELSLELQFDPAAKQMFSKLLDSENKVFASESYALAEVTHIRESFLAAYVDASNEELIKTVCTPLLRHHSFNSYDEEGGEEEEEEEEEEERDIAAGERRDSSRRNSGSTAESSETNHLSVGSLDLIDSADLSEQRLRELSKAFCAALSVGGKGIISHYKLRRLLDAHPRRPVQCIKAAKAYTAPRSAASKIVKHLDLYTFLKRVGLADKVYNLIDAEVESLADLLSNTESIRDMSTKFKKEFKIDDESAFRLAEVVTKTSSESGNYVNFGLHPRSRVISLFELFYTAGAEAFVPYTSNTSGVSDDTDGEEGDNSSDTITTSAASTVIALGPPDDDGAAAGGGVTGDGDVVAKVSAAELEKLSYQFGILTSDAQGTSLVSLLEVLDHLRKHSTNPTAAVSTAVSELVDPPKPKPQEIPPAPSAPVEWVDEWLKSAPGCDLSNYAQRFKDQGFVKKEDFLVGEPFTMADLEGPMAVNVLAHRRRLLELHSNLLVERTLFCK